MDTWRESKPSAPCVKDSQSPLTSHGHVDFLNIIQTCSKRHTFPLISQLQVQTKQPVRQIRSRCLSSNNVVGGLGWKWTASLFFFFSFLKKGFLKFPSISCRDQKPQIQVYITGGEEMLNESSRPQNIPSLHPSFGILSSVSACLPSSKGHIKSHGLCIWRKVHLGDINQMDTPYCGFSQTTWLLPPPRVCLLATGRRLGLICLLETRMGLLVKGTA